MESTNSTLTPFSATAPPLSKWAYFAKQTLNAFNTNKTSWIGLAVFLIVVLLAIFAPLVAPFDPNRETFSEAAR
jgi:peptide/nickel transport system permease protein